VIKHDRQNKQKQEITMKTSLTRAILLAGAVLGFATGSCVKEDLSGCAPVEPDANVALDFYLAGESRATAAFQAAVHSVDLLVLDSAGNFVRHDRLEQPRLQDRQGIDLYLPPGKYRVTCWANSGENTSIDNIINPLAAGVVIYKTITGDDVQDADKLYRAPAAAALKQTFSGGDNAVDGLITIVVPPATNYRQDVDFYPFHNIVEAHVTGYSGDAPPVIEISGIPAGAEIVPGTSLMDATTGASRRVNASKQATLPSTGATESISTIVTFPFDFTDPNVIIRVLDPAGNLIYSVPFNQVVDPDDIPTDPFERVTVRVNISFIGADVTVTIHGWSSHGVQPV
jgi:hypothetical protein